jgi:hypothetical protein
MSFLFGGILMWCVVIFYPTTRVMTDSRLSFEDRSAYVVSHFRSALCYIQRVFNRNADERLGSSQELLSADRDCIVGWAVVFVEARLDSDCDNSLLRVLHKQCPRTAE